MQLPELIFWLSLSLFNLLAVIYTISSGLRVGDLLEAEEKLRADEYKDELKQTEAKLQTQRKISPDSMDEVSSKLKGEERTLREYLRKLRGVNLVLGPQKAVFHPASVLLLAIIISSGLQAKYLPVPEAMLSLAIVLVIVAIVMLVRRLQAISYLGELQTPVVSCTVECADVWKRGSQNRISATVLLRRGRSLHCMQVLLYLPQNLSASTDFDRTFKCSSNDPMMPNYNAVLSREWGVLKRDIPFVCQFDTVACKQPGSYQLYYRAASEEYSSPCDCIDVKII